MDSIAALSAFVGRWFALIVVVAGGIALATPDTFVAGSAIFGKPDYRVVIDAMRRELATTTRP